jgi:hypothetical protein
MRLSARVPLAQELDLAAVSVSVDRLLHEEGGAGELGHSLAGDAGAPPVHASRNSPTRSVFRSFPGDEPRVVVKLRIRRGQLEADLDVDRVTAHDPALCAGLAPSTDLWTLLTIDDGFNPPLPVQAIQAWECREKPDGGHVLLAPFGG